MEIIRGKIKRAQKIVIYGPEGIGKSTFASKFPEPLFIDTEGSTMHMDVARTKKPSSFTMLLNQVKEIKSNPSLCKTLVIDTADWAEQLCITEICAKAQVTGIESFGYGKGYVYLVEEFGRLLNLLEELVEIGIHVVVTAHASMRKFEQPDEMGGYDRWELKLQKKTAPLLKEWADMVLFSNYKTFVVNVDGQGANKGKNKAQGGKRVMYTTHHSCWDAKNRHDLPSELPFDFNEIAHCVKNEAKVLSPPKKTKEMGNTAISSDQATKTPEIYYWCKIETGEVLKTEDPKDLSGLGYGKIRLAEYQGLKDQQEKQEKKETIRDLKNEGFTVLPKEDHVEMTSPPTQMSFAQDPDYEGIPKSLLDLMTEKKVTSDEIKKVVAKRGYYPKDTLIKNYDLDFVNGVLVGAWEQVFKMILEARDENPS